MSRNKQVPDSSGSNEKRLMVLTDIAILFFYCLVLRWWHTQRFFLFDRYLNTYKKYQDLFNNKAETEINAFIQDEPVLLALSKVLFFLP